MARVQLPPAQDRSGRYVSGKKVIGVYDLAGDPVTGFTTAEGSTQVTYPVESTAEGVFAAFYPMGTYNVHTDPAQDGVNNITQIELLSAADLAETSLSAVAEETISGPWSFAAPTLDGHPVRKVERDRDRIFTQHDLASDTARQRVVPAIERFTGGPQGDSVILKGVPESVTVGGSIFWFSPFRALGRITDPLEAYYAFYSPDHAGNAAGICWATAPHPTGPWRKRNADGTLVDGTGAWDGVNGTYVFQLTGGGNQAETPTVMFVDDDPDDRPLYMFIHGMGGFGATDGQSTFLATSALTSIPSFTQETTKLQMVGSPNAGRLSVYNGTDFEWRGSQHAGYFRCFQLGTGFVGYSLLHEGNGLWRSADCRVWELDRRVIRHSADWLPVGYRLIWHHGGLIHWRGARWLISSVGAITSAGGEHADRFLAATPIAEDLRNAIGSPIKLIEPTGDFESDVVHSVSLLTDVDGTTYVYWMMNDEAGHIFLHVGTLVEGTERPVVEGSSIGAGLATLTGARTPGGALQKTRRWEIWDDTALPSWLVSNVVPTFTDVETSSGVATFTGGDGAELCTNPDAATDTAGWTNTGLGTFERVTSLPGSGWPSGLTTGFHCVGNSSNDRASFSFAVTDGNWYRVRFPLYLDSLTATEVIAQVFHAGSSLSLDRQRILVIDGVLWVDLVFEAQHTDNYELRISQNGAGAADFYFSRVSVKESVIGLRTDFALDALGVQGIGTLWGAIHFTLEGLDFNNAAEGTTHGASMRFMPSAIAAGEFGVGVDSHKLWDPDGFTNDPLRFDFRPRRILIPDEQEAYYSFNGTGRRNITLSLYPRSSLVVLRQNDQVLGWARDAVRTANGGPVRPMFFMESLDGSEQNFRVRAVEVAVEA